MSISPPRSGYTLPVFACASAIASLQHLHGENELNSVTFNLLEPP
ncbi:cobalt-precorrin-5B (C(1))-methyltransferase, partial [Microcystis sp. BLCC-F209]